MKCKMENGKLTFEDAGFVYQIESSMPVEPERVVAEALMLRRVLNDKASGNGWTGHVQNALHVRERQLEHLLMTMAIDSIKLKESR